MRFEGFKRVDAIWSWLPSFRAAAETENISEAARELGISASAISRTVGLLEHQLERDLLERHGRNVRLTGAGHHLLAAARDAMRLIDEALNYIEGHQYMGSVVIAASEPVVTAFLLPGLAELKGDHCDLVPELRSVFPSQVPAQLRQGDIDVAFSHEAPEAHQLKVETLGSVSLSLYAAAGHHLAQARVTRSDLQRYPFVGLAREVGGEPWPLDISRRIAMRVGDFGLALRAALSGDYLAVLPDVLAQQAVASGSLVKLCKSPAPTLPLLALTREQLPATTRADLIVEAVRRQVLRSRDSSPE